MIGPYPYKNVSETVVWFESIFKKEMNNDGCRIVKSWDGTGYVLIITDTLNLYINHYTQNEKLNNIAREYGLIVTIDSIILGFDETKLIRNRHLLIGNKLGLL